MPENSVRSRFAPRLMRELFSTQIPLTAALVLAAVAIAFITDGAVPTNGELYATARVAEEWWVLFLLGVVSGGLMALIGGGAALLALPYCVVFLDYTGLSITPTMLLVTLINPLGAWLGFRGEGLLNRELALLFGGSAVIGGLLGPVVRFKLLYDPEIFAALVGLALMAAAIEVFRGVFERQTDPGVPIGSLQSISTAGVGGGRLTVVYRGRRWTIPILPTLLMGTAIGVLSSAIGLGGGFLLIPLLSVMFRMPLQLVAAASIPYIIALSCSGLAAYGLLAPAVGEPTVTPDWAFGLFIAAGGAMGAWTGAKAQQVVLQRTLHVILGLSVGVTGIVYVAKAILKL